MVIGRIKNSLIRKLNVRNKQEIAAPMKKHSHIGEGGIGKIRSLSDQRQAGTMYGPGPPCDQVQTMNEMVIV